MCFYSSCIDNWHRQSMQQLFHFHTINPTNYLDHLKPLPYDHLLDSTLSHRVQKWAWRFTQKTTPIFSSGAVVSQTPRSSSEHWYCLTFSGREISRRRRGRERRRALGDYGRGQSSSRGRSSTWICRDRCLNIDIISFFVHLWLLCCQPFSSLILCFWDYLIYM